MNQDIINPHDHPDFVGGWVWTKLEMRWIEDRIAKAVAAERERFALECIDLVAMYGGPVDLEAAIRARGQA